MSAPSRRIRQLQWLGSRRLQLRPPKAPDVGVGCYTKSMVTWFGFFEAGCFVGHTGFALNDVYIERVLYIKAYPPRTLIRMSGGVYGISLGPQRDSPG